MMRINHWLIPMCIAAVTRCAVAQLPSTLPPMATPPPMNAGAPSTGEPPKDAPLVEKKWEELSNQDVTDDGAIALKIKPDKWKHAETENFIIHYRRATEAHKVAREIEYDLWFVAKTLGATPSQYRRKSHVFVFQDEAEWKSFLASTTAPKWSGSYAWQGELFLNVRDTTGDEPFDSKVLAHETTHVVVTRLYPFEHWPVWLNEGFAEYMGSASVAARNHQYLKSQQHDLSDADIMPLNELFALKVYPEEREKVDELYWTGEKFVRYLMDVLPKDRFRRYVTEVLATGDGKEALMRVYGDKIKDFDTFQKKFNDFGAK